jgi:Xaa-Pro dipeptidase
MTPRLFDYERASALMAQAGVDALLASSRPNVSYLAGYWHNVWDDYYLMWDPSVTHKTLVGVPQEESKFAFIVAGAGEVVPVQRSDTWIQDRRFWGPGFYVQSWTEPNPDPGDPMHVAAAALAERGLEDGCIAVEFRYLGVSYFERLRSNLPRAKFIDAEPILWSLRMVKTAEEIRRIRVAAAATAAGWNTVIRQLREGMTEVELQHELRRELGAEGIQFDSAYCLFGPSGVTLTQGPFGPSKNALKPGLFVRTDIQGKYENYYSDMSRVAGFGQVTREMASAHALVKRVLERLLAEIGPGMSCGEIRQLELELYKGSGYGAVVPYTGHGVGQMIHEPPYLFERDHTRLAPGMVLAIEPTVCYSSGGDIFICLEDQVLVTENGCERLTSGATLELYPD